VDLEIGQYHKKYTILSPENGLVASLTHKEDAYMTRFGKSTQLELFQYIMYKKFKHMLLFYRYSAIREEPYFL
jgi:hypothetical protein